MHFLICFIFGADFYCFFAFLLILTFPLPQLCLFAIALGEAVAIDGLRGMFLVPRLHINLLGLLLFLEIGSELLLIVAKLGQELLSRFGCNVLVLSDTEYLQSPFLGDKIPFKS